jgi:hypothetical protein
MVTSNRNNMDLQADSLIASPPRVSSKNKLVLIKDDRRGHDHEYRTVLFLVAGKPPKSWEVVRH